MSFFQSLFGFLPYVFSIVLGWGERVFSSLGISFVGWAIFAVGSSALIKIFAPVVGQNFADSTMSSFSHWRERTKERQRMKRDVRNKQKRLK